MWCTYLPNQPKVLLLDAQQFASSFRDDRTVTRQIVQDGLAECGADAQIDQRYGRLYGERKVQSENQSLMRCLGCVYLCKWFMYLNIVQYYGTVNKFSSSCEHNLT